MGGASFGDVILKESYWITAHYSINSKPTRAAGVVVNTLNLLALENLLVQNKMTKIALKETAPKTIHERES
jgi:hypothetical protein